MADDIFCLCVELEWKPASSWDVRGIFSWHFLLDGQFSSREKVLRGKCQSVLRAQYSGVYSPLQYRFLLNWCEPGFCSASVSKYCFSPSDRVRCNFLSFYVAKTVSVLVFSIDNSAGQGPMPGLEHYDYEHSSNASEDEKIFIKLFYYFKESFCGKNV